MRLVAGQSAPASPRITQDAFCRVSPDLDIWDAWPLQDQAGTPSPLTDGSTLWMALGSPRFPDPDERARRFDDWMNVRFQLHQWHAQATIGARRSLRNGYLRFLRGWGVDASSVEGAVLKGWVESRMGIPPTFHREPLGGRDEPAFGRYVADRTRGHARTSAIDAQLDLVYTFTQYELARRHPGERWLTLWRGQNDLAAHEIVEALGPREWVLRQMEPTSRSRERTPDSFV